MQNYDPNDATDMRTVHVVEMTFQQWDYRTTRTARVGGNVTGLSDNLECALSNLYDELADGLSVPCLKLLNEAGDTLDCEDDEDRQDEWLKDLLVKAEIVAVERGADAT